MYVFHHISYHISYIIYIITPWGYYIKIWVYYVSKWRGGRVAGANATASQYAIGYRGTCRWFCLHLYVLRILLSAAERTKDQRLAYGHC